MNKFYFSTLSLILLVAASFILCSCGVKTSKAAIHQQKEWALVLHGGAGGKRQVDQNGNKLPVNMSKESRDLKNKHLQEAALIGQKILENGGSALDAVQAVVVYLEDCPIFNAGKGAVMNSEGVHELDAAIMDGSTLNAGAIAGVKDVKNPIKAARLVMEHSPHVLLIGEGASSFAKEEGVEIVENAYFSTERSAKELERIKAKKVGKPMGTVGCVALDKNGNLAAATSTGGMSGKSWGRVGDVPIIGAGTYANNESVAVSGTGHGELWIRAVVGHEISSLYKYKNMSLQDAAHEVIWNQIDKMKGSGGGVICIDKYGQIIMDFNTAIMNRAWVSSGEPIQSAID